MALPRKQLQEKLENVTPETVKEVMQWILDGHTASLEAVQEERDAFKAKAETVDDITRERDVYKEQAEKSGDAAKVQAEFDAYKAGVEKRELNARKTTALDAAFKAAGVARDVFRAKMLKTWDMDTVELDEGGKIKDMDGVNAAIQKDWSDFIATSEDKPLPSNNPPSGGGQKFTAADINKMSEDEINKNWEAISKALPNLK